MGENSFLKKIRFITILIVSVFAMYGITAYSISIYVNYKKEAAQLKNNYLNNHKNLIKEKVYHVINIINSSKSYNEKHEIPDKIKYFVENYRFGIKNRGYVFILKLLNINGGKNFAIMYANANRPDIIGKYISDDFKDARGKEFRKEFLKGLRENGECFVKYWYKKLNTEKIAPKISFFKLTKDKKYIVAAGVYLDDIDKEISNLFSKFKQNWINNIILFIMSSLIMILIIVVTLNFLSNKLKNDFNQFILFFKTAYEKNDIIETDKLKFKEFQRLAEEINKILNEKKHLLDKLLKSEEKFRTIFEKSSIPMLLLEKNEFIDCNDAAVKMLKATRKEELFKTPGDFSPDFQPDGIYSKEKAEKIIENIYNTGESMQFEWLHKRLDGELFWSVITLTLIPYENRKVIFVTWVDISEIKNIQNQLEEEKEKLAVTLYSIGDGVITTDKKGNVEFLNRVAEKLTGWNIDDAKGKKLEEIFNIINEITRKKVENPVEKVLKEGKIIGLANHTILVSKDGREYNIEDSAAPIRDRDSNIIGVVLVFRDETEKAKLKNELIKSEKLKSVATLAAGIAHDFNNILTGIYGNLDLVKLKINNDSTVVKYIDLMGKSIDRAKRLTSQLLTFAKGGAPVTAIVDIKDIVKETVEFNISGDNIATHFSFQENLWRTNVDKYQISEVISNLIINAKHATKNKGNIYITIENSDEETSHKELGKFEKFLKIVIRDDGKGIPEDIMDKIFDPFFTTKEKGTGLGLSTAYSIVEKHNGFIVADSKEGEGSTFTIYLPAEETFSNDDKISRTDKERESFLSGKKIMVMDDENMIRDVTKDLLENFGADVELCKNGEEAIEKYKQKGKFDIVIMDLTIRGGMGGKEAIKEILKIDKDAKVIVSSGYFNDPVIADYKAYGFKGKLMKPVMVDDAIEEIKRVLML